MATSLDPVENDEITEETDYTGGLAEDTDELPRGIVCQESTPHDLSLAPTPHDLSLAPRTDPSTSYHRCTAECDYTETDKADIFDGKFRQFWDSVPESPNVCSHWKSWELVKGKLKVMYPKLNSKMLVGLQKLVCAELKQNGDTFTLVKLEHFLRLIKCFGPFSECDGRCYTLDKLDEFLRESSRKKGTAKISWFAGDMSRAEAEERLQGRESGTFLIRLSQTEFGHFVLSVVAVQGETPLHINFGFQQDTGDSPGAPYIWFYQKKFITVHKLVKEFQKEPFNDDYPELICVDECPDLPFNAIVTGYSRKK